MVQIESASVVYVSIFCIIISRNEVEDFGFHDFLRAWKV